MKLFQKKLLKYLSSDNDLLFKFYQWQPNCRILEIEEIKSIPYTPASHPFVERLIGTLRRELLDQLLFWSANYSQNKLESFQRYYNEKRAYAGIDGLSPLKKSAEGVPSVISLHD